MKTAVFVASAVLLGSTVARADENFRCGKWVVTSSATVSELLAKCGQPVSKQSRTEDVRAPNANGGTHKVGESVVETWTFDRGTQAAAMVVTIRDGTIKSIDRKQ